MDYLADGPFAADSGLLSLLTGVTPLSDAGSGATVLSAQLLREGCPINKLLTILDEYRALPELVINVSIHLQSHSYENDLTERGFNPTVPRLFGPNATMGILGKMCFDFSNGLHSNTIAYDEMGSILDWIGFSVDVTSLRAFFAQKALTVLAVWDALISTVREHRHFAAFDILLSAHLSITDQAPWNKTIRRWYYDFPSCVKLFPTRAATLMKAYPCDQCEVDKALQDAIENRRPTEFMKQLISAGASLKNKDYPTSVDRLICDLGCHKCETDDLNLLGSLLEAGAVIDKLSPDDDLGWRVPGYPYLATDYLLLNWEYYTHNRHLWSLVSSHSDRQQTTVTVPGIFEAAQGGQEQLRSYLGSRLKPSGDQLRQQVLELALSEASGRGYVNAVQSLLQFGVDPNGRMLHQSDHRDPILDNWHPVIRAVNNGELDTLRILISTNIVLLKEEVGEQLDLCSLRSMESSRREQIMRVLSTLDLATASRRELLLRAVDYKFCCCGKDDHFDPDFGFVSQLLEVGLASLHSPEHLDQGAEHILVRAIRRDCGIDALNFLAERDVEVLSAPSATTMEALLSATLERGRRSHEILEFLHRRVEGLQSFVQENVSSLLSRFLENMQSCCMWHFGKPEHWEDTCAPMATVKWFLDLGAPLKDSVLAKLVLHANDSFMLTFLLKVADMDALNECDALQESISRGRLNLAVALIERGVLVNGRQLRSGEVSPTPLQAACKSCAPLWFIRFLVDKGADVNGSPESKGGSTALQAACRDGAQLSCIRFLIEKGAAVNAPPSPIHGFTALEFAAVHGLMNVAGLLLDHGADVNALSGYIGPSWSFTFIRALDLAAKHSRLDMVHFLLAAGARSCQPGRTGVEGAIELATREGHSAVARLLQEHVDSRSGDPLEAERRWLRENSHACLYNGRIQDAGWVAFMKRTGRDSDEDFTDYMGEKLNQCHE